MLWSEGAALEDSVLGKANVRSVSRKHYSEPEVQHHHFSANRAVSAVQILPKSLLSDNGNESVRT